MFSFGTYVQVISERKMVYVVIIKLIVGKDIYDGKSASCILVINMLECLNQARVAVDL